MDAIHGFGIADDPGIVKDNDIAFQIIAPDDAGITGNGLRVQNAGGEAPETRLIPLAFVVFSKRW
jgi:hypothetical protein